MQPRPAYGEREDEEVLYINKFWCRWGWKTKRLALALTFSPVECKLYLIDMKKKMIMRALPWSNTRPVEVSLESKIRFNIDILEENSSVRTYNFYDEERNQDVCTAWVDIIQEISNVRSTYVHKVLGRSAQKELKITHRKSRIITTSSFASYASRLIKLSFNINSFAILLTNIEFLCVLSPSVRIPNTGLPLLRGI